MQMSGFKNRAVYLVPSGYISLVENNGNARHAISVEFSVARARRRPESSTPLMYYVVGGCAYVGVAIL